MIKQTWFCDYCRALGIAVYDETDAYGMGQLILNQHAKASPGCGHAPRAINEKACGESTILLEGALPEQESYADDHPA